MLNLIIPLGPPVVAILLLFGVYKECAHRVMINENKFRQDLVENLIYHDILKQQFQCEYSKGQEILKHESRLFVGRLCVLGQKSAWSLGSVTLAKYRDMNYFIMAGHVFWNLRNSHSERLEDCEAVILIQGHRFVCKASDFYIENHTNPSKCRDLALIKAPQKLVTDLCLVNHVELRSNMPVTVYGFSMGSLFGSKGLILSSNYPSLLHTATTYYGQSGGPVVLSRDKEKILVGISTNLTKITASGLHDLSGHEEIQKSSKALHYKVIADKIVMHVKHRHCFVDY